jgi:hypothetical protein
MEYPYLKILLHGLPKSYPLQGLPRSSRSTMRFQKGHMCLLERKTSPCEIFYLNTEVLARYYSNRHHGYPYQGLRDKDFALQNSIYLAKSVTFGELLFLFDLISGTRLQQFSGGLQLRLDIRTRTLRQKQLLTELLITSSKYFG